MIIDDLSSLDIPAVRSRRDRETQATQLEAICQPTPLALKNTECAIVLRQRSEAEHGSHSVIVMLPATKPGSGNCCSQ